MSSIESFGQLVKARRRELGLTQDELAHRVGCAPVTLRKIEYDDLRPSVQIAERLAMALNIPLEERAAFVRLARTERAPEPLTPTPAPKLEEIGAEDLTGRSVRGYALAERIGAGGMGAVYRAMQPVVEREVAIKIILPEYANQPDFIRRFEAEAQIVARLEHPHIVPLYDYWREPNVAFLVMRLLRGGSLRQLLEKGAVPLDVVTRLLEQIGSALGVAHRAGVVHRDLKPANVMLDEDTNAYLADFGIAKNLSNPNLMIRRRPMPSLARPPIFRRSKSDRNSCARRATSMRWASCCTNCSRARFRSAAPRRSRSCISTCMRRCPRWPRIARACPKPGTTSSRRPPPKIRWNAMPL